MKLEVGQKVWVKRIGNEARNINGVDGLIIEAEVVSVARKYFTLKSERGYFSRRFFIDSGADDRGGYISGYQVYLSKQEIYDEVEAAGLYQEIRKTWFDYGAKKATLSQLRAVKAILEESK